MAKNAGMKTAAVVAGLLTLSMGGAMAQVNAKDTTFDFGLGKAAPGHVQVTPTTTYSEAGGYGFEPGAAVTAEGNGVTSGKPFLFSVALPEGNYDVKVTLGDKSAASVTTVKAESRRLMLEKVETKPGEIVTRTFTVNIRTPKIASGGEVKLKDREKTPVMSKTWDNKLTLEFNNTHPVVDAIEITRDDAAPTLFIMGDSTVTDQTEEPWCAWGQMLPRFFKPGLAVANYAESGESLRSSMGARRLDKTLSAMKPGDFMLIQFGHNDQKDHSPGAGAFTTYKTDLIHYVTEARAHGGIPVLVSPMNRRRFDAQGKLVPTLGDYPEAVRQAAKEQNVPLIDLNAMSKTLFETMGPDGTLKAFVHYPANSFPGQSVALKDDTHFNTYGAYQLAKCIVEGIKSDKLGLTKYLANDTPAFDPAHPDPVASWNLPVSPSASAVKPEGS